MPRRDPRRAVPLPGRGRALIRDYLDRARAGRADAEDPLTPREHEIVKLVAEGHTTDEIAADPRDQQEDGRAPPRHILEKLGMRDRVELTRYAIRRGLVEP